MGVEFDSWHCRKLTAADDPHRSSSDSRFQPGRTQNRSTVRRSKGHKSVTSPDRREEFRVNETAEIISE